MSNVDELWQQAEQFTKPHGNGWNEFYPTREEKLQVLLIKSILKVAAALEKR